MKTFGPYPAVVDLVHDGDTVYLTIDLGFDHEIVSHGIDGTPRLACRVYGINAPELSTVAGKTARDYAQTLLPAASYCAVISHGWDKYGGRFDGTITLPDGRDFATEMTNAGHAVPLTAEHAARQGRAHPELRD